MLTRQLVVLWHLLVIADQRGDRVAYYNLRARFVRELVA